MFSLDGDLGAYTNAKAAYMKQKHRMIWERRHGPIGSGTKKVSEEEQEHWELPVRTISQCTPKNTFS